MTNKQRTILVTWDAMVVAMSLKQESLYSDLLTQWLSLGMSITPKLTGWGH